MSSMVSRGGVDISLARDEKKEILARFLSKTGTSPRKVLLIPPDYTRFNSGAGELSSILFGLLAGAEVDVMPALGTHVPMTEKEIRHMFGEDIPLERFLVHDWRRSLVHKGDVSPDLIREWSEGRLDYSVRIEVNKVLFSGYDLVLSIGQIVPHEVAGMANYTKNICVGVGGEDTINKSHFLGAAYGMERIMGRTVTPVRKLFNYGCDEFLRDVPIFYILSVMQKDDKTGTMAMRGLYAGRDMATFSEGAELSRKVNLTMLDSPLDKVVVYLDPHEFKSTWLGNKAIYRTRMAMADGGELIVLAPGLREFGEDPAIDSLVRKFGYRGTPATLDAVKNDPELRKNLSAAAHLIHGSSEGRFRVTYCPGEKMSLDEMRGAGFDAEKYSTMAEKYDPKKLRDGFNELPGGEKVFFISNPGLGLWALREKFRGGL